MTMKLLKFRYGKTLNQIVILHYENETLQRPFFNC